MLGIACAPIATAGPGCRPTATGLVLPRSLSESSGVAVGRRDPNVLWTHNDGASALYALDASGQVSASFPVQTSLSDWEDIAIGRCGGAGFCLYLADIGDNQERRSAGHVRILRVPEPDPARPGPLDAESFPIRLPDGPRDMEALFVLPGERLYLVTKGRNHGITVYRYPPPLRPDTVTLEEVQQLTEGAAFLLAQVTGASASPDGSIVSLRTYQSLQFYRMEADTLARVDGGLVNLRTLEEVQGEGVAVGPGGLVVLTSEGGPLGGPPSMTLMRCALEGL